MKYIVSLILILSFHANASELENSKDVVIRVSTNEQKLEILRILKAEKLKIKVQGEKFLLVSPEKSKNWKKILDKIRSVSPSIGIAYDHYLKPLTDLSSGVCKVIPENENLANLIQVSEKLCVSTSRRCNEQSLDWAPRAMGADLAEEIVKNEIKKANLAFLPSKTAVIDTGFDVEKQSLGLLVPIKTELADPSARDVNTDEGGHGTNVAGMIAGKYTGITSHTTLSLYKIGQGRAGTASNAVIAAAVEKACKDNNDVVNLSWTSELEEEEEINAKETLWYEVASRLGCLVVKAAGNSGIRKKRGSPKIEITDPLLTVSALDDFDELASFSTSGQVAAPGAGVYSLLSSEFLYQGKTQNRSCSIDGQIYGSINGTSFAAPSVAGTAAQVISILKARNMIPESPSDKIRLLKSILIASQYFPKKRNGINSYGAALIAKSISSKQLSSSIEELASIGRTAASESCKNDLGCPGKTCENKISCLKNLRLKYLSCDLSFSEREMLAKGFDEFGETNLLASLTGKFTDDEISRSPVLQNIFNTEFFDGILKNAESTETRAYLLSTETWQRRPEWKDRVRTFLSENLSTDAGTLLLSDEVKQLPEWPTWIRSIANAKNRVLSKNFLTDPTVQAMPEYDEWLVRYLERNDHALGQIDILRHPVVQKSLRWKEWARKFLQTKSQEINPTEFLSLPEVMENAAWEELATLFWRSSRSSDKNVFLRNSAIQNHPSWERFARNALAGDISEVGPILTIQRVQKLLEWKEVTRKFMAGPYSSKEFLLMDPAVQRLSEYNEWMGNFFRNPENSDLAIAKVLQHPGAQKHPDWAAQVKKFISQSDESFYKLEILSDSRVQDFPEWNAWIDARFEKSDLGYSESSFLKDPRIKSNPRWAALAETFLKKGEPNFMSSFLLEPEVRALPGWEAGVSRFVRTASDSFMVEKFLGREEISSSPQWASWISDFVMDPKTDSQAEILSEAFALRHPKWPEISMKFLNMTGGDKEKADFLLNEYVQLRPEWKSMKDFFLKNCKDPDALERFRSRISK